MRARLTLSLIALGLTLALTAAPVAAGTVDQQQTTALNIPAVAGNIWQAQVFTAGLTGQLDQVDVYLTKAVGGGPGPGTGPGDDLTVEIWSVTAGLPDSPLPGASATVLRADVPANTPAFVAVSIGAPSVAGTQYAIVLSAPAASLSCPGDCWAWGATDNGAYAGGDASASNDSGADWFFKDQDQAFRTYVAVPPPATPAASTLPNAAMDRSTGTGPLLALGLAALLLGSLGTLAFANSRRR